MPTPRGILVALFAALTLGGISFASPAPAQGRPAYFDQPAELRVVGSPHPGEALPVLVVLPPTGVTAAQFYRHISSVFPLQSYVLVLPAGAPSRAEYGPDFTRFVDWFDARVTADLARAAAQYTVDPARVYLAGFSLGGDLSWALIARHPDVFRGALVMGSRCSSHMSAAAMTTLRARDARVVFGIGLSDLPERVNGLLAAHARVEAAGVRTELVRWEGAHHPPLDASVLAEALRVVTE